jgi:hypothetical protein
LVFDSPDALRLAACSMVAVPLVGFACSFAVDPEAPAPVLVLEDLGVTNMGMAEV